LSEEGDCELLRVKKLEIFWSLPDPENPAREPVLLEPIPTLNLRPATERQHGGEQQQYQKIFVLPHRRINGQFAVWLSISIA
jgi:hypothetical protein